MAGKPQIPYGEYIVIILGLIITILFLVLVSKLLSVGCGNFRPGLIVESFNNYTGKLVDRLNNLDKSIEKDSELLDTFQDYVNEFNSGVCYITKQIDDSLQSNYVANVPETESKLPPNVQKEHAQKRQENSKKYIANIKKNFVTKYRNMPIIECFDSGDSADEESLKSGIEETSNNLKALNDKFINIKKTISDKELGMYYVSLAYNDKYIKQSTKVVNSIDEGFANEDVIDFSRTPSDIGEQSTDLSGSKADADSAPITRIETLEDRWSELSKQITLMGKNIKIIKNTIDLQQKTLKSSTAITNDEKVQKEKMDNTYNKKKA